MSQENIEIVRPAVDAFDRGDRAAWLALPDRTTSVYAVRRRGVGWND